MTLLTFDICAIEKRASGPQLIIWVGKRIDSRDEERGQTWESFLSAQLTWLGHKMTRIRLEVDLLTVNWLDLLEIQPTFDFKMTRHFIIIYFTLHKIDKDMCVLNIEVMVLPIKVSKFVGQHNNIIILSISQSNYRS